MLFLPLWLCALSLIQLISDLWRQLVGRSVSRPVGQSFNLVEDNDDCDIDDD